MTRRGASGRTRVAVSQRVDYAQVHEEFRDSLDQRLISWIQAVGALPVPVPNRLGPEAGIEDWFASVSPDAIVLSGGNDIGENSDRDETEGALIELAKNSGFPLLGICRGMQMMAHVGGTSLESSPGHAGKRHTLRSLSKTVFPEEVNSFHNWRLTSCPTGYSVVAEAADGSIEAIRHRKLPWEGWMWHPEREKPFNRTDIERARELLGVTQVK